MSEKSICPKLIQFVLLIFVVAACIGISYGAEIPPDGQLREALLVDGVGSYGRRLVHTDPIEEMMLNGNWSAPSEGDEIDLPDGKKKVWQKVTAGDDGWLTSDTKGGYLYVEVESDEEKVMLLHMMGNNMAYVNGVPRIGSKYQYFDKREDWAPDYNFIRLPIVLRKGSNDLLFQRAWRAGGRVKVRLIEPTAEVMLNCYDLTLPDLILGKAVDTVGAVAVTNCSSKAQDRLLIRTTWPNGEQQIDEVGIIQPMSVRKVGFTIRRARAFDRRGAPKFKLEVGRKLWGKFKVIDLAEITLKIKKANEHHKCTFISTIDGSVQYYAVSPATEENVNKEGLALVFSIHGADVEALNQASSYAAKPWCNIVSPTNRRPFGFDWEDWGRMDMLEVYDIAVKKFSPDPRRIYLTGHSMGGHGTWINGSTYPDKFAAIGPSAGWISFWSYRGAERAANATEMEKMLMRAEAPSDTMSLSKNLTQKGVYIIHGSADDNVRADQSYKMIENLKTFHKDYVFHEEPDAGHWWDYEDTDGADCVDWPPLFDFFSRHSLPSSDSIRQVDFVTASPGVSAWSHWAGIESQNTPLKFSSISIRCNPSNRNFVGTTDNVARLSLKLDHLAPNAPISVELDGQKIDNIADPAHKKQIWLTKEAGGKWSLTDELVKDQKGPHRYGPFKEAFQHNMIFVIGTKGSSEQNTWARQKARFDAEQWWYQGNGSVDIIADTDFNASSEPDRGVVLYGNSITNAAWKSLLADSPVQVDSASVTIGDKKIQGDDLACLFLRPRKDSDVACVAVVSGTGTKGMHLTDRLTYIFAGCSYPDCVVIGSDMLTAGVEGVRAAGFFGNDWTVDTGDFVFSEGKAIEAYIGLDPRPFVMPRSYVSYRTPDAITVDGKLDEPAWAKAAWTAEHVDIQGQMNPVKPRFATQTKMLWDDDYLYVAAKLTEPHISGTITKRNAVIFNDNDYEVFIDPDGDSHNYFEFEMNALNTVWNLFLDRPYKHAGNWRVRDMQGQKTGVFIKGTINDPSDTDEYWTVEIAFPWKAMAQYAGTACPPADGDQWRLGFSRVEWQHKIVDGKYVRIPAIGEKDTGIHEANWIWSPQGVINMHRPETWGYVQFSSLDVGGSAEFVVDETASIRYLLHKVLYGQETYRARNGRYAKKLSDLNLGELKDDKLAKPIEMTTSPGRYETTAVINLSNGKTKTMHVRYDGKVWLD